MSLFDSVKIAQQGLTAQRIRMQAVSANIANIATTQTQEGGPYRRRQVVLESVPAMNFSDLMSDFSAPDFNSDMSGVRASRIELDPSPFIMKFEPGHPQANAQGYVAYPNVNPAIEMVDLINISRSYEANLAVVKSAKQLINQSLELLRV